jgi:hypothetical protein
MLLLKTASAMDLRNEGGQETKIKKAIFLIFVVDPITRITKCCFAPKSPLKVAREEEVSAPAPPISETAARMNAAAAARKGEPVLRCCGVFFGFPKLEER